MSVIKTFAAAAVAALIAVPGFAGEIMIRDAYARTATKMSKSGAAFMVIMNNTDEDDRVIEARSDVAKRVELHTHIDAGNGVMQMREVEGGFPVEAGSMRHLQRGGDHVMLMGLTRPLEQGDVISVTLVFEKAGEVVVDVPVDLERKGGMMNHGTMNHGTMAGSGN
ncbi:MAG: copper chaperone PCu(A)C [Brevirhabdus sp.]